MGVLWKSIEECTIGGVRRTVEGTRKAKKEEINHRGTEATEKTFNRGHTLTELSIEHGAWGIE